MTFTDTVSSLAHDAVSAASELGSQAADRSADAVSTVAAAAENLATSLAKSPLAKTRVGSKLPAVKARRRRQRIIVFLTGGVVVVCAVVFARKRASGRTGADTITTPSVGDADSLRDTVKGATSPITDSVMG